MMKIKQYTQGLAALLLILLIIGAAEPIVEYLTTGQWPTYTQE